MAVAAVVNVLMAQQAAQVVVLEVSEVVLQDQALPDKDLRGALVVSTVTTDADHVRAVDMSVVAAVAVEPQVTLILFAVAPAVTDPHILLQDQQ